MSPISHSSARIPSLVGLCREFQEEGLLCRALQLGVDFLLESVEIRIEGHVPLDVPRSQLIYFARDCRENIFVTNEFNQELNREESEESIVGVTCGPSDR